MQQGEMGLPTNQASAVDLPPTCLCLLQHTWEAADVPVSVTVAEWKAESSAWSQGMTSFLRPWLILAEVCVLAAPVQVDLARVEKDPWPVKPAV